jgi:plasmid stability protein
MSSLTVRNLDESVKNSLRLRASRNGWSMEQEARQILQKDVAPEQATELSFSERVNSRFSKLKVQSVPIPARQISRAARGIHTPLATPQTLKT